MKTLVRVCALVLFLSVSAVYFKPAWSFWVMPATIAVITACLTGGLNYYFEQYKMLAVEDDRTYIFYFSVVGWVFAAALSWMVLGLIGSSFALEMTVSLAVFAFVAIVHFCVQLSLDYQEKVVRPSKLATHKRVGENAA